MVAVDLYYAHKDDQDKLRREAVTLYDNNSTKYTVDISAYEYVEDASVKEIDGMLLRVYTPEMIVVEKIRAMCQSMKRYQEIIPTAKEKKRARDLFDIHKLFAAFPDKIEINKDLVENVFNAKNVPLDFLNDFEVLRDGYRIDWELVLSTIHEDKPQEGFDFYFDFAAAKIKEITDLLDNKVSTR